MDNQNIAAHCLVKEAKYKQLFNNYRVLMRILFSIADMSMYFDNAETISKMVSKNIALENDLEL